LGAPALILGVWGWVAWVSTDRQASRGSRRVFFIIGLAALSLALALYFLFVVHAYRIGGFGENFGALLAWARAGFGLCVAGAVLSVTGRGKSRVLTLASALLLAFLWVFLVSGM
jgi:hypothetical protein